MRKTRKEEEKERRGRKEIPPPKASLIGELGVVGKRIRNKSFTL